MLLIYILIYLQETECRPDEINGELVGYNYVFGLELFHFDEFLDGITFGQCVEVCDSRRLCRSLSYLKNEVGVCKLFLHDRFDEKERHRRVSLDSKWIHYSKLNSRDVDLAKMTAALTAPGKCSMPK